ncbi:MAG: hypothetical protein LBT42_01005 [Tannerella sp.]|jgi:hypothetical protein|nr:hypothetical protein [Tannerella sp.]
MRKATLLLFNFIVFIASYSQTTDSVYSLINQNISVDKKKEIAEENKIGYLQYDVEGQTKILSYLLNQGMKASNNDVIFFSYCTLAHNEISHGENRHALAYLDSAKLYLDDNKDMRQLAVYHYLRGAYTVACEPENSKDGFSHFFQALHYYELLGDKSQIILNIIMALTDEAAQRSDTASINTILTKVVEMNENMMNDRRMNFLINGLHAIFNRISYDYNNDENLLDSILFYEKRVIDMYESGILDNTGMDTYANLAYTDAIEYETKRGNPDSALINSYMTKARLLASKLNNPLVNIRISYIESLIDFSKNNIRQSEEKAIATNRLLDDFRYFGYQQIYVDNYDLLSRISAVKDDYKQAFIYEELKNKYKLEMRNNEIKTLELEFLSYINEAEVAKLKAKNDYHKKRASFIAIICLLLAVTTILLLLMLFAKHKNMEQSAKLEKKANDDAKLKLKLKNEQTEKALLEKYEVLSDFHLKELELMGKSKELEQLEAEKLELDRQVEFYSNKIAEYEEDMYNRQSDKKEKLLVIRDDIKQRINKYLNGSKTLSPNLEKINDSYIGFLEDRYDGHITVLYLKYCICFAIGMGINDVAECFSIELDSVHGIRYRLKKKFGLSADDSLEIFLKPRQYYAS